MTAVGYQHYLDIASSRDVPTFKRRIEEFAQRLEFPLFSATLVVEKPAANPTIVALHNAPEAFSDAAFNVEAAARDPIVQRVKTASAPIVYDQSVYVGHAAGDLWEEQAPHGYHTGIAMALHLSGGRHFIFGVDRPDPLPANPDNLIRMMADLQLLAVFAQETAVRLLMPQCASEEPIPSLSAREQEILKWTLAGKSNHTIGQLLHISLSTVNYHLRTAMGKLGASTKHQAAARANALGLL
ncbi:MAG: autoinducer binding domain-containing protein [Rubrivivax sp.]|nr:autoinducer binding domain-containing protein [Rubrivivax sp.]